MEMSTLWWIFAGAAVVAELLTGTLYLLMVATGMVAGALAAHAGASTTMQITVAAIVGLVATAGWHFFKKKDLAVDANANTDVNQDIGATVHVSHWKHDGTAQVNYRGANWAVQAAPGVAQHAGNYRVTALSGNRLIVEPV